MQKFIRKFCWMPLVIILITGCAHDRLIVKKNILLSDLSVCIDYGETLDEQTVEAFRLAANDFISGFNAEEHRLRLISCLEETNSALIVKVTKTSLAGPGKQAVGCLISTVGIAMPIIMAKSGSSFYISFIYLPENATLAELSLSEDIDASTKPLIKRRFTSFPYFGGLKSQRVKHARAFKKFLRETIAEIEKGLAR